MEDAHTEARYHLAAWLPAVPRFLDYQADFWPTPSEMLRDGMADCKGAMLLTSLLVAQGWEAYATVGWFRHAGRQYGHMWCALPRQGSRWQVMDTTLLKPPPRGVVVWETGPYRPVFRFNHLRVLFAVPPGLVSVPGGDYRAVVLARRAHDMLGGV